MNGNKWVLYVMALVILSSMLLGSEDQGFHWGTFIGRIINSLILFGGLYFLLRRSVKKFLTQRALAIKGEIKDQEEKIKELKRQKKALKEKLALMDQQVLKIQAEEGKKGLLAIDEIKNQEESQIRRLREKKDLELEERQSLLLDQFRERIAEALIEMVKKDLSRELNHDFQRRIIEKNIQVIGERFED